MAAGCGTSAARPRVDAAELGIARTRHTTRTFVMTKHVASHWDGCDQEGPAGGFGQTTSVSCPDCGGHGQHPTR